MYRTTSNPNKAHSLLALLCAALLILALSASAEDDLANCSISGKQSTAFPRLLFNCKLPGKTTVHLHPDKPLHKYKSCTLKLYIPEDAPDDVQVLAFVKDWDYFWYQNLLPGFLKPGRTNSVTINYSPNAPHWEPKGHYGVWNLRATMKPSDLGFAILSKTEFDGKMQVVSATMNEKTADKSLPEMTNVKANEATLPCYEKFEITLNLPDRYPDPFDSSEVLIYAEFVQPDGSEKRVDGFYMQDYMRKEDLAETRVSPQGKPYWCIRFSPTQPGKHSYRIIAEDKNGRTRWGPGTFVATKPDKPGFVRVSRKDPRFLEFDNKDYFFPIGHNIRSPFDTRMDLNFPWKQRWQEGSSSYERRFKKMHNSGQNIAEVWFAAWSLGLEWRKEWFGYHGVGQYNLIHAAEMDRVVELADKYDLYLNLVINNHGKFSSFSDPEWDDNPFNVRNGGWLRDPADFFSNERAIKAYLKLMRYTVARWGYSSRVFAWELWSELDLTGSHDRRNMHKSRDTVEWHNFASRSVKEMDPNHHMVSSHVCGDYSHQNPELISLPELDLCPVDAYHGSEDPLYIVYLMRKTATFNNPYKKPVLITEFGGSPHGGSTSYLEATLHAAMWASTCIPVAGTPMFWWWGIIEEENYYPMYKAVSNFMKGEDRRDHEAVTVLPGVRTGNTLSEDFKAMCFQGKTHALGWVYYTGGEWHEEIPAAATRDDISVTLRDMSDATYQVEFWDTKKGERVALRNIAAKNSHLKIQFPKFTRDIAFKVKAGKRGR